MSWQTDLLRTHLSATVPMRMAELAGIPHDELLAEMERLWPRDDEGRREPWVGAADAMLYSSGPRALEALRQLVTGLAVAALVADGGVTLWGMHWCADHAHCIEVAA